MVTMENYEEYLLLHADGELSEADEKALDAFIVKHPELRHEMEQYMATKLLPDMELVYEGRDQLLKKPKKPVTLVQLRTYAAAAGIAAFFVLAFWKWHTTDTTELNTAQLTNKKIITTAPKDTITGKPVAVQNNIAHISQKPKTEKMLRPSLQMQPKAHYYVTTANKQQKPEQEIVTSVDALPVRQLPENRIAMIPKELDVMPNIVTLPAMQKEQIQNNSMLARLPIKQEGINEIANAVNNKIEKVRNLRDNLKNTDLSVRLGNRELFVVKL